MRRGFAYLTAVVDVNSRQDLAKRVAISILLEQFQCSKYDQLLEELKKGNVVG
jgi:hypothetical protein